MSGGVQEGLGGADWVGGRTKGKQGSTQAARHRKHALVHTFFLLRPALRHADTRSLLEMHGLQTLLQGCASKRPAAWCVQGGRHA